MAGEPIAEGYIRFRPDTSGFKQEADSKLKSDMAGMGISIDLHVNTAKADAEYQRWLRDKQRTTFNADAKVEVNRASLLRFQQQLRALGREAANANVNIDDKAAIAKIANIKAEIERLSRTTARPNLDLAGFARAEADLATLDYQLEKLGRTHETATVDVRGADEGARGIGRLMEAALALAPTIAPVGAAVVGLAGTMAGAMTSAVAGLGVLGIAAKGTASVMQEDLKQLKKDNTALAAAQAQVDNAKGPAARAAALKKEAEAQAAVNELMKAMGPAEAKMLDDVDAISKAWKAWIRGVAIPGLEPIVRAFRSELPAAFHIMTPIFNSAAGAVGRLEQQAFKALQSPFWRNFTDYLAQTAGPTITAFGHILGNVVTGFAGIVRAFAPLTNSLLGGLNKLTAGFARWGAGLTTNVGFYKFMDYVRQQAPVVEHLLGAIGSAFISLAKAAGPVGSIELHVLTSTLEMVAAFAKAHPVITELAVSLFTVNKALNALRVTSAIGSIDKLAGGLGGLVGRLTGLGRAAGGVTGTVATVGETAAVAGAKTGILSRGVGAIASKLPGFARLAGLGGGAMEGLGAALGVSTLAAGALTLGVGAAAVGIGLLVHSAITAKSEGDRWYASMQNQYKATGNNVAGYNRLNTALNTTAKRARNTAHIYGQELALSAGASAVEVGKLQQKFNQASVTANRASNAALKNSQSMIRLKGTTGEVAAQFGITNGQALRLANRLGIDLSQGLNHVNKNGLTGHQILNKYSKELEAANSPAKQLAADLQVIGDKTFGADNQVKAFNDALGIFRGKTVDAKQAADNFHQSLNGLTQQEKENGNALQGNSDKAISNRNYIRNLTEAARTHASQVFNQTHNVKLATSAFSDDSAKIIHNAEQLGYNKRQIEALLRSMGAMPNQIRKDFQPLIDQATTARNRLGYMARGPNGTGYHVQVTADGVLRIGGRAAGMAEGGPVVGRSPSPRSDNIPINATAGEFMQPVPTVQHYGVEAMEAVRQRKAKIIPTAGVGAANFNAGGQVRRNYADGGPVGSLVRVHIGGTDINKFLQSAMGKIETAEGKGLGKQFKDQWGNIMSIGGSGNWALVVKTALDMLHQPAAYVGAFLSLIQHESGGNPLAVNRSDINWQRGTPSVGLAQVIGPTFRAYAGPFASTGPFMYGTSVNPLANVYAGMNYGIHNYGSIGAIPGIASLASGGGYRPYFRGGTGEAGSIGLVGEYGPELVRFNSKTNLTAHGETQRMLREAASGGSAIDMDALAKLIARHNRNAPLIGTLQANDGADAFLVAKQLGHALQTAGLS